MLRALSYLLTFELGFAYAGGDTWTGWPNEVNLVMIAAGLLLILAILSHSRKATP